MTTLPPKSYNREYSLALLFLGLILTIYLIDDRFIPGHDSAFHIMRIESIAESLKTGIWPVRIYVNPIQYWGAPLGIFYPSLFFYVPAFLNLIGVPIEICYNIFICIIIYIGLFTSWCGFSMISKSKHIGFLSAILYISSGYYLLDAYIRHALGELLALSFLPCAIACFFCLINKSKVSIKVFVLSILSVSAIIEAHVLSSVFFTIFCLIYILINIKQLNALMIKRLVFISFVIFTINASFLIPFIIAYVKVPITPMDYIENFFHSGLKAIILLRFLLFWNYWLLISSLVFLSAKLRSFFNNSKHKEHLCTLFYYFIGLFFLFASSELFPWESLSPISNFFKIMQFSWRFLGFSTLFLCVCGGYGLYLIITNALTKNNYRKKNKKQIFYVILLSIIICSTSILLFKHLSPAPSENIFWHPTKKYFWNPITFSKNGYYDYLYENTDIKALINQNNRYYSNAIINNYQKKLTDISFDYYAKTDSDIILPLMNYPGYIATNQFDETLKIQENNNHMMVIHLPKGTGSVKIHYRGLPAFKIADYISLTSLLVFIFYILQTHRQNNWNKLI